VFAHAGAVDGTGEECSAAQYAGVALLTAILEQVGGAEREPRAEEHGTREATSARSDDLDDAAQIFGVARRVKEW